MSTDFFLIENENYYLPTSPLVFTPVIRKSIILSHEYNIFAQQVDRDQHINYWIQFMNMLNDISIFSL